MNIYLLIYEINNKEYRRFAEFGRRGTWSKNYEKCKSCGFHNQHLVEPLLMEWEVGSDVIADFSWCLYCIIVSERVRRFFEDHQYDVKFGRVEVVQPGKVYKRKKMVPFPYTGPKLHWMMPPEQINLDIEKSGLEIMTDCPDCGRLRYKFKMDGLVIPKKEWKKKKIFRITQFDTSIATFISEEALEEILSQNFTNFWYQKAGVIIKSDHNMLLKSY